MARVVRTVVVRSVRLPRKVFRVFIELEGMYRNMVEQLALHAVGNNVKSFTKLKELKYREMRNLYPQLPSHYVYTACQDASTRAKSFLRLREQGLAKREYPEVRSVSIWLDNHLWKPNGYTSIRIATHRGWITVDFEPHKLYWRYANSKYAGKGWKLASGARIKFDKRNKQLIIYLVFEKNVEEYKPKGYITVDVNESNVAILVDGIAYLFETDMKKIVLGYYYRRKRIQEKYDKKYGTRSREKRKTMRKLRERKKKNDVRWKIANIIVRTAYEKQCAIVLEDLGKQVARKMIERISDKQLRHRIYQSILRGMLIAIDMKAKELGVPIMYKSPKGTSSNCPLHDAPIIYENGSRVGRCSKGGEKWHRDVASIWNLLLRTLRGDGSNAPSPAGLALNGSPVPLGSTATTYHDPIRVPKPVWARWKSLPHTQKTIVSNRTKR